MARQTAHAEYQPVLRGLSSVTLSERESQLLAVMDMPGWAVLEELWDEMDRLLTDGVVDRAGLPSHEEYIQAHSKVQGLRLARLAPKALSTEAARKREEARANA